MSAITDHKLGLSVDAVNTTITTKFLKIFGLDKSLHFQRFQM